jgi:hypothetical protein
MKMENVPIFLAYEMLKEQGQGKTKPEKPRLGNWKLEQILKNCHRK